MPAEVSFFKHFIWFGIPITGWMVGWKLDRMEDERMTLFRDKSALYKRDVPPKVPSWP